MQFILNQIIFSSEDNQHVSSFILKFIFTCCRLMLRQGALFVDDKRSRRKDMNCSQFKEEKNVRLRLGLFLRDTIFDY